MTLVAGCLRGMRPTPPKTALPGFAEPTEAVEEPVIPLSVQKQQNTASCDSSASSEQATSGVLIATAALTPGARTV